MNLSIKDYNVIPNEIKQIKNPLIFKREVKNLYFWYTYLSLCFNYFVDDSQTFIQSKICDIVSWYYVSR